MTEASENPQSDKLQNEQREDPIHVILLQEIGRLVQQYPRIPQRYSLKEKIDENTNLLRFDGQFNIVETLLPDIGEMGAKVFVQHNVDENYTYTTKEILKDKTAILPDDFPRNPRYEIGLSIPWNEDEGERPLPPENIVTGRQESIYGQYLVDDAGRVGKLIEVPSSQLDNRPVFSVHKGDNKIEGFKTVVDEVVPGNLEVLNMVLDMVKQRLHSPE